MKKFSNLYRLKLKKKLNVYEYRLEHTDKGINEDIKKLMNRATYMITRWTEKPAFYQKNNQDRYYIYSFEDLGQEIWEEEYNLIGGESVSISLDREGWKSFIQSLENLFQKFKIKKLSKSIIMIPILRVEFINGDPFLMLDYKLKLVSEEDIESEYKKGKLEEGKEVEFKVAHIIEKGKLEVIWDKNKAIKFVRKMINLTRTKEIEINWKKELTEVTREEKYDLVVLEVKKEQRTFTYPARGSYRIKDDEEKKEFEELTKLVEEDIKSEYKKGKLEEGKEVEFKVAGRIEKGKLKVIRVMDRDKIIEFVRDKKERTRTDEIEKVWENILEELEELESEEEYELVVLQVKKEQEQDPFTYPDRGSYRIIRYGDLDDEEKKKFDGLKKPYKRVTKINELLKEVQESLEEFGIDGIYVEEEKYTNVEKVNSTFEVIDRNNKTYTISNSSSEILKKILKQNDWKPFIRHPNIHLGFFAFGEKDVRKKLEKIIRELYSLKGKGLELILDKDLIKVNDKNYFVQMVKEFRSSESEVNFLFVFMDENDDYWYIKRELLGKGIESQVILHKTEINEYVLKNLVLAFLGKTGNYPYFIKEDSEKKKLFVGVDISRKKEQSGGTVNAMGTAIIVDSYERRIISLDIDIPTAGEKLDKPYFQKLRLELENRISDLKNRFIVFHRDGHMPEEEKKAFKEEFKGYKYALVSIVKSGNPRIFKEEKEIENPDKGDCIYLSNEEAILCTYKVKENIGTHIPLRVKIVASNENYTIKEALEDVLKLTLLNFSAFNLGKLPATISFADDLAEFKRQGVSYKSGDHLPTL